MRQYSMVLVALVIITLLTLQLIVGAEVNIMSVFGMDVPLSEDEQNARLLLLREKYAYRRQSQGELTGPETQRMLFYKWLRDQGRLNEGETRENDAEESESA